MILRASRPGDSRGTGRSPRRPPRRPSGRLAAAAARLPIASGRGGDQRRRGEQARRATRPPARCRCPRAGPGSDRWRPRAIARSNGRNSVSRSAHLGGGVGSSTSRGTMISPSALDRVPISGRSEPTVNRTRAAIAISGPVAVPSVVRSTPSGPALTPDGPSFAGRTPTPTFAVGPDHAGTAAEPDAVEAPKLASPAATLGSTPASIVELTSRGCSTTDVSCARPAHCLVRGSLFDRTRETGTRAAGSDARCTRLGRHSDRPRGSLARIAGRYIGLGCHMAGGGVRGGVVRCDGRRDHYRPGAIDCLDLPRLTHSTEELSVLENIHPGEGRHPWAESKPTTRFHRRSLLGGSITARIRSRRLDGSWPSDFLVSSTLSRSRQFSTPRPRRRVLIESRPSCRLVIFRIAVGGRRRG